MEKFDRTVATINPSHVSLPKFQNIIIKNWDLPDHLQSPKPRKVFKKYPERVGSPKPLSGDVFFEIFRGGGAL